MIERLQRHNDYCTKVIQDAAACNQRDQNMISELQEEINTLRAKERESANKFQNLVAQLNQIKHVLFFTRAALDRETKNKEKTTGGALKELEHLRNENQLIREQLNEREIKANGIHVVLERQDQIIAELEATRESVSPLSI
jgi:predicted phage tail protein